MALRVVQWATGGVGVAAIKAVLEHPDLELVGCWVHSESKHGRDVGELIGGSPLGVTATTSMADILALDADAVVYAPLMPNPDEVAALLRSGKNVVTPVGWVYPSEKQAAQLREAGLAGNATLHGTGIAPGGISEKFPVLFSAMSTGVTFVRAEEFSDLRTYHAPDVVRHVMGFGNTPDKALSGPMQKLLDGGFIQAVRMCVDQFGFNAEPKIVARQEIAVATAPIESPIGIIEPGQVAARKFHWEALVGGEVVVRVTVNWLMGEQNLDPAWDFGPEGQRYEMEVRGNPDFTVSIKGFQGEVGEDGPGSGSIGDSAEPGVVATAAHCVNSIPAVCAAPPGVATYRDLPFFGGKAAPRLR
ncbi:dihydrodipicolinate reductase [Mycobacterium sp. AMU20-3851]|uniref:NAD(P)H-dependent amine dehydrogenase family protein n=1 Tax=Mycobacterium sp. AMU20-3851 TaxID=3122055 RepID=UPI0037540EA3